MREFYENGQKVRLVAKARELGIKPVELIRRHEEFGLTAIEIEPPAWQARITENRRFDCTVYGYAVDGIGNYQSLQEAIEVAKRT